MQGCLLAVECISMAYYNGLIDGKAAFSRTPDLGIMNPASACCRHPHSSHHFSAEKQSSEQKTNTRVRTSARRLQQVYTSGWYAQLNTAYSQ